MKYKITNTSAQSDGGARSVFVVEAGKLLAPGESIPCNRIEKGTRTLEDQGVLKIDEGEYKKPSPFPKKKEEEEVSSPTVEPVVAPLPKKIKKTKLELRAEKQAAEEAAAAAAPQPMPESVLPPEPAADDKTTDEQSGKTSSDG